jgi:hypothetical protein
MARREGISVCVIWCKAVWIAFKLLMEIVSQRPALIKALVVCEKKGGVA